MYFTRLARQSTDGIALYEALYQARLESRGSPIVGRTIHCVYPRNVMRDA